MVSSGITLAQTRSRRSLRLKQRTIALDQLHRDTENIFPRKEEDCGCEHDPEAHVIKAEPASPALNQVYRETEDFFSCKEDSHGTGQNAEGIVINAEPVASSMTTEDRAQYSSNTLSPVFKSEESDFPFSKILPTYTVFRSLENPLKLRVSWRFPPPTPTSRFESPTIKQEPVSMTSSPAKASSSSSGSDVAYYEDENFFGCAADNPPAETAPPATSTAHNTTNSDDHPPDLHPNIPHDVLEEAGIFLPSTAPAPAAPPSSTNSDPDDPGNEIDPANYLPPGGEIWKATFDSDVIGEANPQHLMAEMLNYLRNFGIQFLDVTGSSLLFIREAGNEVPFEDGDWPDRVVIFKILDH